MTTIGGLTSFLLILAFFAFINVAHRYIDIDGKPREKADRISWRITWRRTAISLGVVGALMLLGTVLI